MHRPTVFEQSLRTSATNRSFRQKNKDNKDSDSKKTTPNLSRRNSFENRASILRRSFTKKTAANPNESSSDVNLRKFQKPNQKTPSSSKKNSTEDLKSPPSKIVVEKTNLPKLYRSRSLDSVKMSSLNDLTRTTSCSSFFVAKTSEDFLRNFLKNMSILKAGLLDEIRPFKPQKANSEKDSANSDVASLKSDSISSETASIGVRLHQKTTRSSLARHSDGATSDVSFERTLRSSKKVSASTSNRMAACPKENAIPKPKVENPKKQRRKNLKKMINDGFLERLKSRSELRLDFVKEKPSFDTVDGFPKTNVRSPLSPVTSPSLESQRIAKKKYSDVSSIGAISDGCKSNGMSANLNVVRKNLPSRNKYKPNLAICDNKNQKSRNLKLKNQQCMNLVSFDEILERSLYKKCNINDEKDSYLKTLGFLLNNNVIKEVFVCERIFIFFWTIMFICSRPKLTNKLPKKSNGLTLRKYG